MIVADLCHHRYLNLLTIYLKGFFDCFKCFDCKSNLDYVRITKNKKLLLKCFNCNIYYKKKFNNDLVKKFKNRYSFCDNDLNKFVLLLRKGVYPFEYMDSWERFSETSLPSKEDFYSNLNMEDISDIDYRHANNVFIGFKLQKIRRLPRFIRAKQHVVISRCIS